MSSTTPSAAPHRWRFFRAGGLDQVRLDTAADLAHLEQLDQKLWVALSCPVTGLELDEKTLALLDTDKDGRVRAGEVLEALRFCKSVLKDLSTLLDGRDALPLSAFDESSEAGRLALTSAKEILRTLGRPDATEITLEDVSDTTAIFTKARLNGDGVVTAEASTEPAVKQALADIVATVGGVPDRSGAPGVDQAKLDAFYAELEALSAWHAKAESDAAVVLPLGERTAAAAAAIRAVKSKVDDYFARCRLAAFDGRALTALNRKEEEYLTIAAAELSASAAEVAGFPLSRVEAGRALPLREGLNPAWADRLAQLVRDAIEPLLGARESLTEADWRSLVARLEAHEAWWSAKPAGEAEKLGLERVRALLNGPERAAIAELIAEDKSFDKAFDAVATVEKLVRYNRDLHRLLLNFVSFTDFYSPDRLATFQAGTLFLDSRACELCVRVDDPNKHAALATLSKSFLVYCKCTRANGESMNIVAVFSAGDADNLMVGRNGVFYDRKGRDWDANIVKIVEAPISVGEAFWAPYKRVLRYVEEQVAKRAADADTAANAKLTEVADTTTKAAEGAKPAAKPKIDVGTLAAIGVAVGGVATVAGAMLQAFFGLGYLMPLGIIGVLLLISGPSMLIATLKLRQRNLGPLLDANGWAINGRVRINIPFGESLTTLPEFPKGAQRTLTDPYQEKKSPVPALAAALVLIGLTGYGLHLAGYLGQWLGYAPVPPAVAEPAAPAPQGEEPATATAVPNE